MTLKTWLWDFTSVRIVINNKEAHKSEYRPKNAKYLLVNFILKSRFNLNNVVSIKKSMDYAINNLY